MVGRGYERRNMGGCVMGKKINDTGEFPATVPAATDRVLGVDVSDTSNDANGETVTFTFNAVPLSILNNDSGFITSYTVTEADVTAHQAALSITESQISDLGAYITSVVADTTPQLGGMLDVNGQAIGDGTRELLTFTEDASAVNHVNIENEATGSGPIISAAGDDTNIDLNIAAKGTGNVNVGSFTFDADQTVGAGQDDYVLTYDNAAGVISLEAAAGGGGLVPISKTTASADAAVDISLTGGYSSYLIRLLDVAAATDGVILYQRFSTDGGSTFITTNTYRYQSELGNSGAVGYIQIATDVGNATNEGVDADIHINLADGSAKYTRGYGQVATTNKFTQLARNQLSYHLESTTAPTDVRFLMSSGNIASGEFHLYGIADGA